jgi:hypothetical protein
VRGKTELLLGWKVVGVTINVHNTTVSLFPDLEFLEIPHEVLLATDCSMRR